MMLMASANHLLMVFIAVEMASLPSYALAGFLKGRRQSQRGGAEVRRLRRRRGRASCSTASACWPASSAPATCPTSPPATCRRAAAAGGASTRCWSLGTLFILVGLGFKLAAVPFHFWCPDVFEGAAAEVAGVPVGRVEGGGAGAAGPARADPGGLDPRRAVDGDACRDASSATWCRPWRSSRP